MGVDTRRYRTLAFVIASFFAGLAGALLAHYLGTVNPNQFDVEAMVYVLVWVIVGGDRHPLTADPGVVVLTVINEIVLRELGWIRRGRSSTARYCSRPSFSCPTGSRAGAESEASVRAEPGAGREGVSG